MNRLATTLQLAFCLLCIPFLMAVLLCFIAGEWLVCVWGVDAACAVPEVRASA